MYTLTVDVGHRSTACCSALEFQVELLANATPVASANERDFPGGLPPLGAFGTITVTYTANGTAGQSLGIRLSSSETQTNWDNVRLTSADPP